MNAINEYNSSIMSLEEDGQTPNKIKANQNKRSKEYTDDSSNSIFSKFMNSMSKIGQGLKNIMSMRINIEETNDNTDNQNIYDQVSNRFMANEEISLIEAPSFVEEISSSIKKKKKVNERNKKEDSNMLISFDDIRENDDDINNSFNKDVLSKKNNENINIDILKNNKNKIEIKSTLLSKKREREKESEAKNSFDNSNIFQKNSEIIDDEVSQKSKSKIIEKSIISNRSKIQNGNNISEQRQKNRTNMNMNSSIMSLSMKSLDDIKSEVNKRREDNLKKIEDMHKRNGLCYDYAKELEIREKILSDYYKGKQNLIKQAKLKEENERRKREEEYHKLKIKKNESYVIYRTRKPKILLTQTKSTEIKLEGNPLIQPAQTNNNNKSNENNNKGIDFSFNNGFNNSINEQNNNKNNEIKNDKQENKLFFNNTNTFSDNNNKNNDSNKQSLFPIINANDNKNNDNKEKEIQKVNISEEPTKIIDNKKESIFQSFMANNDKNNKEEKTESKKPLFSLDEGKQGGLFKNINNTPTTSNQTLFSFSLGEGNNKSSIFGKKNDEKNNEPKKETKSLFTESSSSFFGVGNQQSLFTPTTNEQKSLFDIKKNNINFNSGNDNSGMFAPKKEGFFNQDTAVSSALNEKSLFQSNNENSLLKKNNPFLQTGSNNAPATNLFGNNEQKKETTPSLFGNLSSGTTGPSLFGTGSLLK